MKRLLICIVFGLLTTMVSFAQGGEMQEISGYCGKDGENIKWTLNTVDSTLVFEGSGEMADYGYGGHPWASYKTYIKTVTLKEGILNLTNYAFYGMNVATVELPTSLEVIGNNAMGRCPNLRIITLPDNLTSIGSYAFETTNLERVSIPQKVSVIADGTFYQCDELTKVVLQEGLVSIGENAFTRCSKLEDVVLPNTLQSIGSNAFAYCTELKSVDLPNELNAIGSGAFSYTSIEKAVIPATMTELNSSVFDHCAGLTELSLSDGLTAIGKNCFRECVALKSVSLPQQMNTVKQFAFNGCSALEKLEIKGVTMLLDYAFSGCSSLATVILPTEFSEACLGNYVFDGCNSLPPLYNENCFFFMPNNGAETYSIPDGITMIAKYAFYGNESIKQLNLPSSITSFGSYAFASSAIEELDLSNLEYLFLNAGAFANSSIKQFISPTKIANYPQSAFENCKNLTQLDLTGLRQVPGVIYFGDFGIGSAAFRGCENLNQVLLPVTVGRIEIGQEAFKNCTSLETIDLSPAGTIYMRAFENCTSLKKIEVSDFGKNQIGTYIYAGAFAGCTSLDSVVIGSSGVQNFPMSAFEGCISLSSVVMTGEKIITITDFNQSPYNGLWEQNFADFNLPFDNTVFTMLGYLADDLVGDFGYDGFWSRVHINRIYETLSGECGENGDNITWSLDTKDGILRLEGSGNMKLPEESDGLTWKDRGLAVKEIILPDSLESICPSAFSGCAVRTIKLNKYLRTIGASAFNSCGLESIQFNDSLKVIEELAFENCNSLNRVELNEGLERIGKCAFRYCKWMEEVLLPSSIISMDEGAFVNCEFLKSITLPKNIKAIPGYTLSGCSRLEKVVLPTDAQSIGVYAFSGCSNLMDIYCPAIVPPTTTGYGNDQIRRNNISMHIPQGATDAYRNTPLWGMYQMDEYYAHVGLQNEGGGKIFVESDTIVNDKWSGYFTLGEPFAFSVIPDEYYDVKSVTVNGVESISMLVDGKFSFDALNESKQINVTFAPYEFSLSLSVQGRGHILLLGHDVESSGKFAVTHNDRIEMEFVPNEGYKMNSVMVDGANVTDMLVDGKYIVEYPTNDVNIEALFSKESYKLTYMIDDEIYKEAVYEYEAVITPEPMPEGDYKYFEWIGLPTTMPAHDVVVTASYETGIMEILIATQHNMRIYSPDGKQLDRLQKGLNIVIMDNGENKKVFIR